MIQLVIQNGQVIAVHRDDQNLRGKYPGRVVTMYDGDFTLDANPANNFDPRTKEQKQFAYKDQRRLAYPLIEDQLDMLYQDQINGTTIWRDTITAIKIQYPKPV